MAEKILNNIPLRDFLDLALGSVCDRIGISKRLADAVALADPDEQYCHIEKPDAITFILWRIEDWRTSSIREGRRRELASLERQTLVLASELKAALAKRIEQQAGLSVDESETLIHSIIRSRNAKAAEMFNINLAELVEADEALQAFKLKQQKR